MLFPLPLSHLDDVDRVDERHGDDGRRTCHADLRQEARLARRRRGKQHLLRRRRVGTMLLAHGVVRRAAVVAATLLNA